MAETHSEDEKAQEMERKKALLVYKSNQHSASDDDDDDEEEHDHDHDQEEEEEETASVEDDGDDEEDARSVHSEAVSVEEEEELHDEEDNDDDEEEEDMEVDEDEVQVEKDDDESVNAPSDDDLDSTATPRHDTEDDDEEDVAEEDDTEDSATESKASQPLDEDQASSGASKPAASTGGASSSGSKLNVEEIIAARRRTGARKECEVCHEGRNGRRAMLCATCKTMYHSSCYRKKYSKLITAMGKQWFCPDCEPAKPVSPEKGDSATPRKKKGAVYEDSRVSTKLSTKELKNARGLKSSASSKGHRDGSSAPYTSTSLPGDVLVVSGISGANLLDQELKRVTEIAMRSGRKINALIVERTEEMLFVTQSMTAEIEDVLGSAKAKTASSSRSILHHDEASSGTGPLPPLSALTMISSSEGAGGLHNAQGSSREVEARDTVLRSLHEGLFSLKNMLEQLQVMGIQSEVDLIRDIKVPPVKEEPKPTTTGTTTTARKSTSGAAAARTAAALSAAAKREAKPGASRLYSAKQIQKLEEWYQKSSRPEASEIQAMYRIINSPEYADKELQPDGISVKQIRIWFDNRRAKERLDYMRLKMKDISTADMDAEDVKRMKAAYIDEAKEVLEARVSRLKENGKTVPLIDEADTLLLQSSERPLPMSKSTKASPASKTGGGLASFSSKDEKSSTINQKKRIRIDYVASVRKAVKDARDAGKSEDEIKLIKTAAIERARERLHVPYKNARLGPTKPLGKEEVTHVKMTMLKLLEEDAPAEELTDVVELLLSVIIPHDTLVESQLHRQLGLVLKAHKDNKELVKQTNKLLDEFNTIIEKGDDATLYDDETSVSGSLALDDDKAKSKKKTKKDSTNLLLSVDSESLPGTPGASPDSPGASPDARKARVKFSRDQLMKLERHFHKEDTPSKKNLEKLSKKLNDIAARDAACEGQDRIDYKQIRSWFYKRRSTNQPPQALSQADLREIELAGTASSSSSASETESDSNDEAPVAAPARKSSKSAKEKAAAPKRKVTDEKPAAASKRQKKTDGTPSETKTPARVSKKEAAASASAAGAAAAAAAAGKQHSGRIFNVKQLATIIEEYEKNPRPTVERLEELQRILNQDDHADDNFVNPLGVTKRQIKTWFSNRRAKERLEVIRMKVQTTDSSAKGKGSSKSKKTSAVAKNDSGASGSDDDGDDDDDDMDEDQPIKKPTKTAASAPSSAKKELFTASSDAAASRHMSDDDLSDDNDDDDDDDVDMGSDDDDDDVEKDSEDDKDDDDDKDSDDDDDDDSDDDVDDAED